MTKVIVDTGSLVAFLDPSDGAHDWSIESLKGADAPLICCDVVIAEAHHLLSKTRIGADGLLSLLETGGIHLTSLSELDVAAVRKLATKYADVPMDLADACVVRLSELHPEARVLTTDSDFRVYRRNGRQAIPLLAPVP